MSMIIKNAMIYDMEGNSPFKGDIYIEKGKIKEIGENLDVQAEEVIEAEGLVALPGLIDAHSHVGGFNMLDFNDIDLNEMTDPVTPDVMALDAINTDDVCFMDACRAGITTMCITPGSGNPICGLAFTTKSAGKDNIRDMVIQNPSALKLAFGMNPIMQYGSRNQLPMTRMGVIKVMRDAFHKAKEYMQQKEMAQGAIEKMPAYDPI